MNLIEKYKQWRDSKRLTRLEADLNILNSKKAIYNPALVQEYLLGYNVELEFTRRMAEYHTWYVGNARRLSIFYKTTPELSENLSYFWKEAPANYRKVHSGLPSLIARKMAIVLFGGGLDVSVEAKSESGKKDDNLSTAIKAELDAIKDNTQILDKFSEAAIAESWGGHCFFKVSFDSELSDYPIIEVVDVRNARAIKERGITTAIEFYNYYSSNTQRYVHTEKYTTDESGNAVIENTLHAISAIGKKEVPLSAIPETTNFDSIVVFDGFKGLLAFEKPNRLPNAEFCDSGYGESDFAGAVSAFDALDETLSEIFKEIRENKTIRYIPASMLQFVDKSDGTSFAQYNNFITNYQKINDSLTENSKQEINITQIKDKTLDHLEKWKVAMTVAVNKAGLSPLALGVTGLEAVNAGMESQRERNKATLETRAIKIHGWQLFIERMYKKLLDFNAFLIRTNVKIGKSAMPEDISSVDISVKFGDYVVESTKEIVDVWGAAKTSRIASTEQAVRQLHKEWSETQILDEVNRIQYETGMDTDTPASLPQLTGIEEVLE